MNARIVLLIAAMLGALLGGALTVDAGDFPQPVRCDTPGRSAVFTGNAKVGCGAVLEAHTFSGATAGAKIAAACSALPAAGGYIDGRGLTGAQALGSNLLGNCAGKPAVLELGHGTYEVSSTSTESGIELDSNHCVVGQGPGLTTITGGTFTVGSTGRGIILGRTAATDICVRNLTITSSGTTSNHHVAAGILLGTVTRYHISNVRFHNLYAAMAGVAGIGPTHGRIEDVTCSGYSYYSAPGSGTPAAIGGHHCINMANVGSPIDAYLSLQRIRTFNGAFGIVLWKANHVQIHDVISVGNNDTLEAINTCQSDDVTISDVTAKGRGDAGILIGADTDPGCSDTTPGVTSKRTKVANVRVIENRLNGLGLGGEDSEAIGVLAVNNGNAGVVGQSNGVYIDSIRAKLRDISAFDDRGGSATQVNGVRVAVGSVDTQADGVYAWGNTAEQVNDLSATTRYANVAGEQSGTHVRTRGLVIGSLDAPSGTEPLEVTGGAAGVRISSRDGGAAEGNVVYVSRTGGVGTSIFRVFSQQLGADILRVNDSGHLYLAGDTINLGGNLTTGGAFTLSGAFAATFTVTGTTGVTFPTSGTLATLAGAETLTSKRFIGGHTSDGGAAENIVSRGAVAGWSIEDRSEGAGARWAGYANAHKFRLFSAEGGQDRYEFDHLGNLVADASVGAPVLISTGTGGAGYLELSEQSSPPGTPTNAARLFVDGSNRFSWKGENGFVRTFDGTANTADRIYVLPDLAGTVALTSGQATMDVTTQYRIAGAALNFSHLAGSVAAAQTPAFTGDVTKAAGSATTALANIPTGTPAAGRLTFTAIAAPSTPAAGKGEVYVDSTSKNIAVKDDAGMVKHGMQSVSGAINDDGSITSSGSGGFCRTTSCAMTTPDIGAATGTSLDASSFIETPQLRSASGAAMIGLGGVTSAFVGIKRNGTVFEVRLGDDSAYANTAMRYLTTNDGSNGLVAAGAGDLFVRPAGGGNFVQFDTGSAKFTNAIYAGATIGCTGTPTAAIGGVSTTCTSDESVKDVVGPYERGLEALRMVEPIRFHWRFLGEDPEPERAGFGAWNVRAAIPEAAWPVTQGDGRTLLTLSDRTILAVTVNAVKELDRDVEDLKARLLDLEGRRN